MFVLVFVACLLAEPSVCRAFPDEGRRFVEPVGCMVATMLSGPTFELSYPNWRIRETLCVPQQRLDEVLVRYNGYDT